MTISVCMGTYNGEKFITEQLECLHKQTRQPDEVILCDDGSGDKTVELIEAFLREHQLHNWKLIQNEKNLGYPENFYRVMEKCTCDVVFLADQDDIWVTEKLEKMAEILETTPECRIVSCKFGLIDAQGESIHALMNPSVSHESAKLTAIGLKQVFGKYEWPGMVLAYRRDWLQKKMEERKLDAGLQIPHDICICSLAAEENGFYQIDQVLAFHRRHDNNTAKEEHRVSKLLNKSRKVEEILKYNQMLYEFREKGVLVQPDSLEILSRKIVSMEGRLEALLSGKRRKVLANAWRQRKYTRAATLVCDLKIVGDKQFDNSAYL